jgi:hypothetical protein
MLMSEYSTKVGTLLNKVVNRAHHMFLTGYPRSEIEAVCNEMIKEEAGYILHSQPKTLTNYISNK